MKQEIKELNAAVQRLAYEIQRTRESDTYGRQTLALRLENEPLKFVRRLPPVGWAGLIKKDKATLKI